MPMIRIEGPAEKLIRPPTGVPIGRDFEAEHPHLWISTGGSPSDTRKLDAYELIEVSDSETAVLTNAGIVYQVIEEAQ